MKIEKLDSENEKSLITVILQTKKFNILKQRIVHKFILSQLINYTDIKWGLPEVNFANNILFLSKNFIIFEINYYLNIFMK